MSDNDKYYQEVDEATDEALSNEKTSSIKKWQGSTFSSVGRYEEISHLSGVKYKNAQDKIHELDRKDPANSKENLLATCSPRETVRVCQNRSCRVHFIAKIADVKRGWAKFCSKSCKAQHQHWS